MIDTVKYRLLERVRETGQFRRRVVVGVQVGRFAIRCTDPNEPCILPDGASGILGNPYAVDHMASGAGLGDFETWADAVAIADDVSRFSERDPDGKTPTELIEQLGPVMFAWLHHCARVRVPIPFRTWQQQERGQ